MSEGGESREATPDGAPVGGERRRRLTLAPRPWVGSERGATPDEVSGVLLAGPTGIEGGTEAEKEVLGAVSWSSGGCSSVGSSSTTKLDSERVTNGSRFWVLSESDDSDVESCSAVVPSPDASGGKVGGARCRTPATGGASPGSMDELAGAAALRKKLWCAGRSGRTCHPELMHKSSRSGRPWKGPLPPARVPQARSLGDLWVVDRRSGSKGSKARLVDLLVNASETAPPVVSPERKTEGRRRDRSNFKSNVLVPVRLNGPTLWPGLERGRPKRTFRGLSGLGRLFCQGGRRIDSHSNLRPPPVVPTHRDTSAVSGDSPVCSSSSLARSPGRASPDLSGRRGRNPWRRVPGSPGAPVRVAAACSGGRRWKAGSGLLVQGRCAGRG
jgi:hypothetical protein